MKDIKIKLVNEALEEFNRLNKISEDEIKHGIKNSFHQQLLKSVNSKIALIKADPQYGDHIPRNIMKKSGLDVNNLWAVDLSNYWRMLYTITGNKIEIICFILKIFDHNKYNELFGYRKK